MQKFFHIIINRNIHHTRQYKEDIITYTGLYIKPNFKYDIISSDNPDFDEYKLDPEYEHIFIWDCFLVKKSFHLIGLSKYQHIVFLDHKTSIFKNNYSKNEPINENFLLMNNMKCIYLNPDKNESNYDYDLIIDDDTYIFKIDTIKPDNIKPDNNV